MSFFLTLLPALALGADTLRACTDVPKSADLEWSMARTVRIENDEGVGTGVVVSPDGFVLTADHVVSAGGAVRVVFKDESVMPGTVVRSDPASDLALVRIEGAKMPCLPTLPKRASIGSDLYVIGSPGGKQLSHSVSKGIVSAYRDRDGVVVVQTDATINQGNSGGPVVTSSGQLVGIVSYKLVGDGVEGLGFGVAVENVPAALDFEWTNATSASMHEPRARVYVAGGLGISNTVVPPPHVDLAEGIELDTSRRYAIAYRPKWSYVAIGVAGLTLGGVEIGLSHQRYKRGGYEYDFEWKRTKTRNTMGWVYSLVGAASLTVGFALPEKNARVIVEDK